jgi:hypothetical protein
MSSIIIRRFSRSYSLPATCLLVLFLLVLAGSPVLGQAVPTPTPVVNSSQIPPDVSIPPSFQGNPIAFFDDYSWRAFIALVWPALQGQRGTPDPNQGVGGKGPRLFETYKSLYEVFHNDGSAPVGWNDFDKPQYDPCGKAGAFNQLTLASFSKFSNLGQAGFGSLVGPIVAQGSTPTYARYATFFNQVEVQQITDTKWYLRSNLPPSGITFKNGSIDLKASWMDMTFAKHPERYYTRTATVMDPYTGQCKDLTVGLVGLHIVQKTPTRPQWIWSTFEQVDNVPPPQPGAPGTFGFNDGTGAAQPAPNPIPLNPLPSPMPTPFNITRAFPIHSSTQATNKAYQAALKSQGSGVWQFYQLTMTQWPLQLNPPNPIPPTQNGLPANTFPGTDAATAFSNTTLETFDQKSVGTSCMACHNLTMTATDFLWSLKDHAFPPKLPNLMMQDAEIRNLTNLIRSTHQSPFSTDKQTTTKTKPSPTPKK